MSVYSPSEHLQRLVRELIDQLIDQAGMSQLESILQTDHDARRWYLQELRIHGALHRWASRQTITAESGDVIPFIHQEIQSVDEILKEQRQHTRRISLLAAAAVIAIGVMVMQLFFIDTTRPPTLAFETSPGTQFTLTHSGGDEVPTGMVLENGSRLQLSQGAVELTFGSGVKSIIKAPADLTLHDDNALYMSQGTGWFHVPKGAEGFRVKTKDLNIVDLGTEFGVLARPNNHDEIHVFKGRVQVTAKRVRKESATLIANEARRIDPIGRLKTIPLKTGMFASVLPRTPPYIHFSFESQEELLAKNSEYFTCQLQGQESAASNAFIPGVFGKALSLDGVSQYIETDWEGILGNEARSIAFWFKISEDDKATKGTILRWGTSQGFAGPIYAKQVIKLINTPKIGGSLLVGFGGAWFKTTHTNLPPNVWLHVAMTYDGTLTETGEPHVILYLNGIRQKLNFSMDSALVRAIDVDARNKTPLLIGAALPARAGDLINQNSHLKAQLDELFIINDAIDEATVRRLIKSNRLHP